jgi:hypothetical protein
LGFGPDASSPIIRGCGPVLKRMRCEFAMAALESVAVTVDAMDAMGVVDLVVGHSLWKSALISRLRQGRSHHTLNGVAKRTKPPSGLKIDGRVMATSKENHPLVDAAISVKVRPVGASCGGARDGRRHPAVERADREMETQIPPRFGAVMESFVDSLQWRPIFLFRVGYPTHAAAPSPRRSIQTILV